MEFFKEVNHILSQEVRLIPFCSYYKIFLLQAYLVHSVPKCNHSVALQDMLWHMWVINCCQSHLLSVSVICSATPINMGVRVLSSSMGWRGGEFNNGHHEKVGPRMTHNTLSALTVLGQLTGPEMQQSLPGTELLILMGLLFGLQGTLLSLCHVFPYLPTHPKVLIPRW